MMSTQLEPLSDNPGFKPMLQTNDQRTCLEPGLEALQLLDGPRGPPIHIAGQQAAVVVGKAHERLVHALQGQLLAPPLAGLPVAPLAVAVHLCMCLPV